MAKSTHRSKKSKRTKPAPRKRPKKKPPTRTRRIALVAFTDAQIIAAAAKPPFPDQQGTYEDPGLILPGGKVPANLPQTVACPGSLVIYSSWAMIVPNCAGFAGPGAGNNAVVQTALQNANAVAAQIPCADDCKKNVVEIWRGWGCGNNPLTATGAVELKILCDITG